MIKTGKSGSLARDDAAAEALGRFLRARRNKLGLTQVEAAKVAEVSQSYISHIERGERLPSDDGTQQVIARVYALTGNLLAEFKSLLTTAREAGTKEIGSWQSVTLAEERARQEGIAEVWVVADKPLELRTPDEEYLNLVLEGITATPSRKYLYWTSSGDSYRILRSRIRARLHATGFGGDVSACLQSIAGIVVPPMATWFSFVIYNPIGGGRSELWLCREVHDEELTGHVMNFSTSSSLRRVRMVLETVYNRLTHPVYDIFSDIAAPRLTRTYLDESDGRWTLVGDEEVGK